MPSRMITDPDIIQKHLTDESNIFQADPALVKGLFLPETREEIKEILTQANQQKVICTVSAGGTGITGSRVPVHGGWVISMEKITSIETPEKWECFEHNGPLGQARIALDREKQLAWAPTGLTLDLLCETIPEGLFYPPDPTESTAMLGGTIATNASGARSFFYGATRKWVQALEIVLGNGEELTIERGQYRADADRRLKFQSNSGKAYDIQLPSFNSPDLKNAAGIFVKPEMDLVDLFISSEGIFGIITAAMIRLKKQPESILGNATFFASEEKAFEYVKALREGKDKGVLAIEFFSGNALTFMRANHPNVSPNYKAGVYTELVDPDDETMEWLVELGETHEAQGDWFADSPREMQKLKEFRHALPEGVNSYLKQRQSSKLGTDFVVPMEHFDDMLAAYKETASIMDEKFGSNEVRSVYFGHIGDCHLHFNFIAATDEEKTFAKQQYKDLAQKAIAFGGTISGEHGVGKKVIEIDGNDVPYLELMLGKQALSEIEILKRQIDSNNILNIGNIINP